MGTEQGALSKKSVDSSLPVIDQKGRHSALIKTTSITDNTVGLGLNQLDDPYCRVYC